MKEAGRTKPRSLFGLTLLALAAFSVLIALGVWQLRRLTWKNDLIQRFEQALSKPPVAYTPPVEGTAGREFMRVAVKGTYEIGATAKVFAPTPSSLRGATPDVLGDEAFSPLVTDRYIVFVDRGFVPQSLSGTAAPEKGVVTVTGILRRSQPPGFFTPPPEPAKDTYFSADIAAMATRLTNKSLPIITDEYLEAEPDATGAAWPKPRDPKELLSSIPNRHLEYALTWFGIAAALAGVFASYAFRR